MTAHPSFLSFFARVLEVSGVVLAAVFRFLYRKIRGRPVHGPELARQVFEDLGGSFIKFGQILSLQIDTLPREYCDALLSLLDRVLPFPENRSSGYSRKRQARRRSIFTSISIMIRWPPLRSGRSTGRSSTTELRPR